MIAQQNLDSLVGNTIEEYNVGNRYHTYAECGTSVFTGETCKGTPKGTNPTAKFSLCCGYGAIKLPPINDPPKLLKKLSTGNTQKDCTFREKIQAYNSSLAFASMSITGMEYNFPHRRPYCFRISGQIYHFIGQMEPEAWKSPVFSQIYIYDQEHELENHLKAVSNLDKTLVMELQDMIKEVNPYEKNYKHVGDMIWENPVQDIHLVLQATGKTIDPWCYNVPTGNDIAVIIPMDSDIPSTKDVVVYRYASQHPNGKALMKIDGKHPMYYPNMYVLMFP